MEKEANTGSEQILDLATQRRREKQVVDVEVEKTLIVIFQLQGADEFAGQGATDGRSATWPVYGLPASAVESIVPVEQITYVPGTPPWVLGVVNVRGEIESVLDLKAVLGLGHRPGSGLPSAQAQGTPQGEITPESRLLIAQDGDLRSGLLVDRVIDIAYIPLTTIRRPPTPLEGGKGVYVAGETEYGQSPRPPVVPSPALPSPALGTGGTGETGKASGAGEQVLLLLDLSEIFRRALETEGV